MHGLERYSHVGLLKVIGNDVIRWALHHFLSAVCSNNVVILYIFIFYSP